MLPAAFQIVFRWRIIIMVLLTTLCAGAATWVDWKRPTYYVQAESGQGQGTGTGQRSGVVTIHTTAPGAPPQSYPNGR